MTSGAAAASPLVLGSCAGQPARARRPARRTKLSGPTSAAGAEVPMSAGSCRFIRLTCADVRWACVWHRREAARAIRPPLCKMVSRTIRPRLDRGSAATRWRQHSVRTETRQCQRPDSSEPTLVRPPLARCNMATARSMQRMPCRMVTSRRTTPLKLMLVRANTCQNQHPSEPTASTR